MLLNALAGRRDVALFVMQAVFVTIYLRLYVRFRHAQPGRESQLLNIPVVVDGDAGDVAR